MDKDSAFARFRQSFDYLKDSGVLHKQSDLCNALGIGRSHVSEFYNGKEKYFTEGNVRKYAAAFSEYLNPDWLLYGTGQMEKADRRSTRPHIPADKAVVAAGFVGSAIGSVQEDECEVRPVMAPLPWYDFTIEVSGDSMEPTLQDGDIIACEWLPRDAEYKKGKIYVLDTNEGAVVKRITNDGNVIHCHSDNPKYKDFIVDVDSILRIARVVGFVREL